MKTVLRIKGMSCSHCVRHVSEALLELEGISSADVKLDDNTAAVEHDESVTVERMKAAVEEAGYEAV